jgi:hypothetical protein
MEEVEKKDNSKLTKALTIGLFVAVAASIGLTHLGVADVSKHVEEACMTHSQITELLGVLQGPAGTEEVLESAMEAEVTAEVESGQ